MKKLLWRKKALTGRHILRLDGKKVTILPGETVTCTEEELGVRTRPHYDLISKGRKAPAKKVDEPEDDGGKQLIIKPRGRGYYDIINIDNPDKPLNEKALRLHQAKDILDDMEAEAMADPLMGMDRESLEARADELEIDFNEDDSVGDLREAIRKAEAEDAEAEEGSE